MNIQVHNKENKTRKIKSRGRKKVKKEKGKGRGKKKGKNFDGQKDEYLNTSTQHQNLILQKSVR